MSAPYTIRIMSWPDAQADARRVRFAVFVEEQKVPAHIELDEWDALSEHAIAADPAGRAVATGRLLPDGHVGRMAVLRDWRRRGVGGAILTALLARATQRGMARAVLNAQTHARGFYARHGFMQVGGEFMEAGIPHITMERDLGKG